MHGGSSRGRGCMLLTVLSSSAEDDGDGGRGCGSNEGGTGSGSGSDHVQTQLSLLPFTVWCTEGMIARLLAFLPPSPAVASVSHAHTQAGSAAMNRTESQASISFQMSATAPHVCVVLLLPVSAGRAIPVPLGHLPTGGSPLYSYAVLDLVSCRDPAGGGSATAWSGPRTGAAAHGGGIAGESAPPLLTLLKHAAEDAFVPRSVTTVEVAAAQLRLHLVSSGIVLAGDGGESMLFL